MTITTAQTKQSWLPDEEATKESRALRMWQREYLDLSSAASLAGWDQQTKLPSKAQAGRARTLGALSALLHEMATSDKVEALITNLEAVDPESVEARVARRRYELDTKLPSDHVRAMNEASSAGYVAWNEARKNDDFSVFLPHLERNLELARKSADYFGYQTEAYDALHDLYEEGSRASDLEPMFEALRKPINRLLDMQPDPDTSVLERDWDISRQEIFGKEVVTKIGFDFEAGRLDETVHPFCSSVGEFDTRLTTRYDLNWLPCSLFGTIHEAGHGIYEQSFDRLGLPATIAGAPGLGMHESQSRGFENIIGRSKPFWEYWFPRLCELFPEATEGVSLEEFVGQVNTAKKSFIRVEADELSYNLHLAVRFELERAMVNGELTAKDLPEAWNSAFEKWFGLRPPSDRDGCLQDVHWSSVGFGYFPTYTLGNVYAAQFAEVARRDLPNWDDLLRAGNYSPIVGWFDDHVYCHGNSLTGRQIVERITGSSVDVDPLVRYLEKRFAN